MPETGKDLSSIDRREAYARVRTWLEAKASTWQSPHDGKPAPDNVLRFVRALPAAGKATESDLDLAFTEVLRGHLEYFYSEHDDNGISLPDYARQALSMYPKGIHDEKCNSSIRASSLYELSFAYQSEKEFGRDKIADGDS